MAIDEEETAIAAFTLWPTTVHGRSRARMSFKQARSWVYVSYPSKRVVGSEFTVQQKLVVVSGMTFFSG